MLPAVLEVEIAHLLVFDSNLAPRVDFVSENRRWAIPEYEARVAGDPRMAALHKHRNSVVTDQELLPPEDFDRSPFVREFLDRPEVGARHCIAALHDLEGGETFALAAIRPREAGFFDEADKAPLTRIAPHVRRLAAVEMRLQHNDAWRTRLESMLDESGQALAAVTATSRLIYANRPAEALFRAASHVAVRARHLCATHVRDDDMLRRAIAQSAAMGQGGVTGNGAVGLAGARGAPVLFARLWPLPRSRMVMGETEPLVLIAFAPTTRPVRIGADAARVFALTPRERDVIEHLCNRENVASAAAHLGLSVQTVRSYLKSAMLKTGVSSQKDLVKLFTQLS